MVAVSDHLSSLLWRQAVRVAIFTFVEVVKVVKAETDVAPRLYVDWMEISGVCLRVHLILIMCELMKLVYTIWLSRVLRQPKSAPMKAGRLCSSTSDNLSFR